ncbi:HAD family hydrolase [Streptococcus oriscaviae]|uniref:HAD family hydrolase n=1 Tax=Streptococcus oriscaviae TaxID=2781599 RepID=A0ABX7YMS1_9STRE|nr:HAD family hydrolase [Streptococcus oriscaviae]QUE54768.1 HAD family hydrolase [Streptococcus oriscaviae]
MDKWLFFDIGSTLVDESDSLNDFIDWCVEKLNKEGVLVSKIDYQDILLNIARRGGDPLRETWASFSPPQLERPKWPHDKEALFPSVKSVLKILGKKYRLGIIANQGKDLRYRLEQFGILDGFEVIVCSAELDLYKPDVKIFLYALEEAGASPSQSIYIGDRVDNDMIPAKMLGMKTIRVKQGLGQYCPEDSMYPSDWQVSNVQELLEIV